MTLLSDGDLAQWVADRPEGQLICLPPYGELLLPLLGRYQIENATLAIRAVALLKGGAGVMTDEYTETIRRGIGNVKWLGRVQKLGDQPAVYVDGAITVRSAQSFVASIEQRLSKPVVSIVGIPRDRDYAGVYQVMATVSQALIITETDINPSTHFPAKDEALGAANWTGRRSILRRGSDQRATDCAEAGGRIGHNSAGSFADARRRVHADLGCGYESDLTTSISKPKQASCAASRVVIHCKR